MSTDYAVKMPLNQFILEATTMGFELKVKATESGYPILYFVDGSPLGYVYDLSEHHDVNGELFTTFTRYELNRVDFLTCNFDVIRECTDAWNQLWPETIDEQSRIIREAAAIYFQDFQQMADDLPDEFPAKRWDAEAQHLCNIIYSQMAAVEAVNT